jgi:hypothetical protein
VALTLPGPQFLQLTLAVFWLMAFASATHDIAADGFYMLALPQKTQAAFVGVRSTFYRLAMIAGQGGLVYLAGRLAERRTGSPVAAWQWCSCCWRRLRAAVGLAPVGAAAAGADRPAPRSGRLGPTSWPSSPPSSASPTSCASSPSCCCTASPRRSC